MRGERRYLSILAVTLIQRKLYIFDEPTSGVDPEARVQILRRIEQLVQNPEVIVLLSTHTLHEFSNIDCKIHLLHQGRMQFEGSYEEFVHNEADNPDLAFYERVQ
ncbi:hypothetical protein DCC85_15180 [Paenibacillus sp. CAA11]|nr:AAA family ATPase [Paenibacillus sp. CAA11]AWB45430.1 hypothetical protein DCC85_15180 [Paenibacillus sp. CAA11]